MKLSLMSNVWQDYDYCFAKQAEVVFLRMFYSDSHIAKPVLRREMFAKMEEAGIETVPNGIVSELLRKWDPEHGVVVYTDETAHRGCGKELMSAREALELHGDSWGSLFVPPGGASLRHFQFGNRSFTMPFWSRDDWRSQRGESFSYCAPGSRWNLFPAIPYPYFAVDFIPGTDMATDFDFLPGLSNDGLETWMTPREMYSALSSAADEILREKGRLFFNFDHGYGLAFGRELPPNWRDMAREKRFDHRSELDEREGFT